jgi:hypothetical protein
MSTIEEELKKLNQSTFDAEAKPEEPIDGKDWKTFLQDVLAVNFSIRRSSGIIQNKAEMIEFVEESERINREVDESTVKVFVEFGNENFGVVTSVVTLKINNKKYLTLKCSLGVLRGPGDASIGRSLRPNNRACGRPGQSILRSSVILASEPKRSAVADRPQRPLSLSLDCSPKHHWFRKNGVKAMSEDNSFRLLAKITLFPVP